MSKVKVVEDKELPLAADAFVAERLTDARVELPFVRSAFNYDRDAVSQETGLACLDVSRTRQSFKEECDINTIVHRFGVGRDMPSNVRPPMYGDFDGVGNYQDAMNVLLESRKSFESMPARVRERFLNDPGRFMDFCSDPGNYDEALKMGLAMPRPAPAPVPQPAGPVKDPANEIPGSRNPPLGG